jgi:hypothetical protein
MAGKTKTNKTKTHHYGKQIQIAQIRHEPQCTYTVQSMAMEIPRVHDKC